MVAEIGGGLRTYTVGDHELVDGYRTDELCPSGRGQVLLPWPNRIEDGIYEFDGRQHRLPLNEPERQNAIHGLVRWSAWTTREQEPSRVVVEHALPPQPGYPFALAFTIEYALGDEGLSVGTTATNIGPTACPYGGGAHPYVSVGTAAVDSAILRVPARTVLCSDERGLPVRGAPVEGTEYDFRRPRPIGSTRLDHAFTDLERDDDGLARVDLHDPGEGNGVTLLVDEAYGYLMLFTGDPLPDVDRRALAVEPMTCPPNAFRTGKALARLEPGDSHSGRWGITPNSSLRDDAP